MIEKASASGINARATTTPANRSPRTLPSQSRRNVDIVMKSKIGSRVPARVDIGGKTAGLPQERIARAVTGRTSGKTDVAGHIGGGTKGGRMPGIVPLSQIAPFG